MNRETVAGKNLKPQEYVSLANYMSLYVYPHGLRHYTSLSMSGSLLKLMCMSTPVRPLAMCASYITLKEPL